MSRLNPLDHPVCFTFPARISVSAWIGHVPFGMYLIDVLRPKHLAELGTHYGVSYCAFCQAVKELGLDTKCYAIDSWQGDEQTGFYGPEVLKDLEEHHNPLYGGFSRLIQSSFDEALNYFPDQTFDLLHVDGFHTYEAVKQDFEKWLPKMTERGVILFHDINVREREFGVWKFWDEVKLRYPHFEFVHSHGLGVLAVGKIYPDELKELFKCSEEEAAQIRRFFSQMGAGLEAAQELQLIRQAVKELSAARSDLEEKEKHLQERDTLIHEKNLQLIALNEQQQERATLVHKLNLQIAAQAEEKDSQLLAIRQQLHEKELLVQQYVQQLKDAIEQHQSKDRTIEEREQELEAAQRQIQTAEERLKESGRQLQLKERQLQLKTRQLQQREHLEQERNQLLHEKEQQLRDKDQQIHQTLCQLQETVLDAQNKERLIQFYVKAVEEFGQSGSYKLGRALSWPLRAFKQQLGMKADAGLSTNGFNRTEQPPSDGATPALQPALEWEANSAADLAYDYTLWAKFYDTLTDADREAILARIDGLEYKPLISIVMPVYNIEEVWLRKAIESVRQQLYPYWQLCIADDNSTEPHVKKVLEEYAGEDERIKVAYRKANGHISAASNSALQLATGEFVALMDNDDELPEHALFVVASELNDYPEADLIYSDEDKIDEQGVRRDPHFKSDWNPDLFYSCNMISHLGVYRRKIIEQIGGFREGYEGSQDYDLALRFIEQIPESHIRHIPRVLYHWRAIAGSVALATDEKVYAHDAARNAIRSHFERKGLEATVSQGHNNFHRVSYPVPEPAPLVSLVIATRDRLELLRQTVDGLLNETDYARLEIIIVDNQSKNTETLKYLREIQKDKRVKVIEYDAPFNYSAINNLGVRRSSGELVGLVNNDIKVISSGWLKEMVSHAVRQGIGCVGAKLLYPDDTVQHAGVILGVNGVAAHAHRFIPKDAPGYINRAMIIQNLSAVTGACMLMPRKIFEEVGGLDEVNLSVAFNDIDLCIRIREKGYRIMWTPYAELYHLESASRGRDDTPENAPRFSREVEYMMHVWDHVLKNDPYYNPNLTMIREDFSLAVPPRIAKQW